MLVDDVDAGLAVVDEWAAEHLEVQTEDAADVAARVRNAGAIFVGAYAPVRLGDYLAGSNHVLPTGGTARHTSGLSVQSFLRGIHVIECDRRRWPPSHRGSRARWGRGFAGARRGGEVRVRGDQLESASPAAPRERATRAG